MGETVAGRLRQPAAFSHQLKIPRRRHWASCEVDGFAKLEAYLFGNEWVRSGAVPTNAELGDDFALPVNHREVMLSAWINLCPQLLGDCLGFTLIEKTSARQCAVSERPIVVPVQGQG